MLISPAAQRPYCAMFISRAIFMHTFTNMYYFS